MGGKGDAVGILTSPDDVPLLWKLVSSSVTPLWGCSKRLRRRRRTLESPMSVSPEPPTVQDYGGSYTGWVPG